jgi:hypothetical protein
MEIDPVEKEVCYLTLLPLEILNCIAKFLLWEEEEEFIERIEREKDDIPSEEYCKYFSMNDYLGKHDIFRVFSPDKNKIALFNLFAGGCDAPQTCDTCKAPQLVIIDLQAKREEDRTLYAGSLDRKCYRTVGLSTSGTLLAEIKKERKNDVMRISSHRDHYDVLVISDIVGERERSCNIPDDVHVSHLMFNKQETHIIAYARDYRREPMEKTYFMFDLKDNQVNEKSNVEKEFIIQNKGEKNRLLDYFKYYQICKQIQQIEK